MSQNAFCGAVLCAVYAAARLLGVITLIPASRHHGGALPGVVVQVGIPLIAVLLSPLRSHGHRRA